MMRSVKAAVGALLAAGASLIVTVPATVIVAEHRAGPQTQLDSAGSGISFQATFIQVNLLPPFVVAVLIFAVLFTWLLRRRQAHR